jgi:hypothetical protein
MQTTLLWRKYADLARWNPAVIGVNRDKST